MKYTKKLHDRWKENIQEDMCKFECLYIIQESMAAFLDEIERLEAERRWIPISDMSQLEDGVGYLVLTEETPRFPDSEIYSENYGWETFKTVTHYQKIVLPQEDEEDNYEYDSN